jgi:hypothetical protein
MTFVVIGHLKENTSRLHHAAGYLVAEALRKAGPCSK